MPDFAAAGSELASDVLRQMDHLAGSVGRVQARLTTHTGRQMVIRAGSVGSNPLNPPFKNYEVIVGGPLPAVWGRYGSASNGPHAAMYQLVPALLIHQFVFDEDGLAQAEVEPWQLKGVLTVKMRVHNGDQETMVRFLQSMLRANPLGEVVSAAFEAK